MFSLDISTIRLCALIMVLVTLVGLFAFWRFKNFKSNAAWWIAGILLYSLALLGTIFRSALPFPILGVLVETSLVVSGMLFLNAVRVKLLLPPFINTTLAVGLLALISSCYFHFIHFVPLAGAQTVFLADGVTALAAAWLMLKNSKNQLQKPFFACALLFLVEGFYYLGNFVYVLTGNAISAEFFTLLLLFTTVLIGLLNYAFILMAYDDLQQDLDWALRQIRQEASNKLQGMQARWLLALEYANSGAWEVDFRVNEICMSAHWARMLGLPAQELRMTTQEVMQYMHPDDIGRFIAAMKALEHGETVDFSNEHRLRRNNGSWIWVSSRGKVIANLDQDNAAKLVGIDIDITDAKLRQAQLEQAIATSEQAKEVAIQASKAKSSFLTNISHEIRTPMNAILGFSQLLLDDARLEDRQKESLEIINSSGQHLLSLIDDILNLSRVQSGHFQIRRENVNPNALFREISQYYQARIVRDGVQFVPNIEALPPQVYLDPKAIRQICMNLLSNAFKFTTAGEVGLCVEYMADKEPGQGLLMIVVTDTGVGIKPEHLGLIFNVFEQTGNHSFSDEGFGLGLAICKDIVTQMDGRLDVSSRPEEGSSFTVTIPVDLAPPAVDSDKTAAQPLSSPVMLSRRILIVDDIDSNRRLLQRILGERGFEIREASNARDAIVMIRVWQPSLVLMDIRMPMVAGDEAIIEIRKDPTIAQMPIIAITANAFEGERERLLSIGANDFISKPFLREEVLTKVGRALEAHGGKVALTPPAENQGEAANDAQRQAHQFKVLVVDDNAANTQLLVAQLETIGLLAEVARNGKEGYASWCKHQHDIVLTDCAMPMLDGFSLARLIRQTEIDTGALQPSLIIAVTGSPEEYSERCFESGMNDIMAKPILMSLLNKTLGRHLPGVGLRR
ncbi:MAG: response regulator [Pseudomonadota bacterium]